MTSNDNIIDFKAYGEKKAQESNLTIANLYEVQDDTHDDCIPALMGYMIEIISSYASTFYLIEDLDEISE